MNAKIESLPMGEYVKLIDSKGNIGKAVYICDGYCRFNKGYMVVRFDDANRWRKLAKGTLVHVGFTF